MRWHRALAIIILGGTALAAGGCVTAVLTNDQLSFSEAQMGAGVAIGDHDRALIARWYRHHRDGRGPGELPPGLVKMDVLPRDLRGRALPAALEKSLSPLPYDYVRRVIGRDIVLLERHHRRVIDLYRDVIP